MNLNALSTSHHFALHLVPGIGAGSHARLCATFGCAEEVFRAGEEALSAVKGIRPSLIPSILRGPDWREVQRQCRLAGQQEARIAGVDCPEYPPKLRRIPLAPPFLYLAGEALPAQGLVAIVGTRRSSAAGGEATRQLTRGLVEAGWGVVSGLALGIDTAAHEQVLLGKGYTAAVIGSGLDGRYPSANRDLYRRLRAQGTLVSEFPFRTLPSPPHFPMRNRILAGLAEAVVVVEAGEVSGALITARHALRQKIPLFAMADAISGPGAAGPKRLIEQGLARPISGAADLLACLLPLESGPSPIAPASPALERGNGAAPQGENYPDLSAMESNLLGALGRRPKSVDELCELSGGAAQAVIAILVSLELKGLARRRPGNLYTNTGRT